MNRLRTIVHDVCAENLAAELDVLLSTVDIASLPKRYQESVIERTNNAKRYLVSNEKGAAKYELNLLLRQLESIIE